MASDNRPEPELPPESWAATAGVRRSMRANKRKGTKPEKLLASELHRRGLRFRRDLLLRAGGQKTHVDIAFPARRVLCEVLGCYWHGCPLHGTRPKRNAEFWAAKIERNIERDHQLKEALVSDGWTVIWVWEHEDVVEAADRIEAAVRAVAPAPRAGPSDEA